MLKKLLFVACATLPLYAIVTITPVNIEDYKGWNATIKGSFETKRGNSDVDNYSAGLRASYDNNTSYILWGDFSFSYAKASGETNTNKTYTHIRYIHTTPIQTINYELFVQLQTDTFTKIKKRFLSGAGLRYHLNHHTYGNLYFGLGAFYENIDYTTQIDPREQNIRLNSYVAYTKQFDKKSTFSYIGYYQPKIDNYHDYIVLNSAELEVVVYKKLALSFVISYNFDAKPAIGIKKADITQKTSLIYKF
jgi:putative salt-induced outer membrane protein YdiY